MAGFGGAAIRVAMIVALALAALAQTPRVASRPGLVVMLGERIAAADIAELALDERPRALLYAGDGAPDVDAPRPGECAHACFQLRAESYRDADEPRIVEWTRAATRVAFTTGSLREWFDVLYPRGDGSELVSAVREAWNAGALVIGRGDRAALLNGWSVIANPRELAFPECDPHDLERPRSARGLGLVDLALLDTDGRSGGRFERLLGIAIGEQHRVCAWLDADAALVADPASETLLGRGSYALLFDLRRARHANRSLLGARVSVLRDGDVWSKKRGDVATSAARRANERRVDDRELELPDAFDADTWVAQLARFAGEPPSSLTIRDPRCEMRLELDEDSRVAVDERGRASWTRVRLEITWDEPPWRAH